MEAEAAFVLCRTDGSIVADNAVWRGVFAEAASFAGLPDAAAALACPPLWPVQAGAVVHHAGRVYQLRQHTLGEWLLLELCETKLGETAVDATLLAQIGRLTARLIHDFRNQMGGLKLYASYLKKRLASAEPEVAEITEKIIEGLNTMAEHATLISRLSKPVELHCETADLTALIEQLIKQQQPRAATRKLQFVSTLPDESCEASFDQQQLPAALTPLLTRAIEVSPPETIVTVNLQRSEAGCVLSVIDAGAVLTAAQYGAFFDFLTHERLNKTALELAHAKQIIEAHGGTVQALPAGAAGTLVRVTLKQ